MEVCQSSIPNKANSAREKRLKIRRLKMAQAMKNQISDGFDIISTINRNPEESVHFMVPDSAAAATFSIMGWKAMQPEAADGDDPPKHGFVSVCGRRSEMEDAVALLPRFLGPEFDFFGVYDGHGGCSVAVACKDRLHWLLVREIQGRCGGGVSWKEVMEGCFWRMDDEVGHLAMGTNTAGATAIVAVVGPQSLIVANCGDSRAVMSRGRVALPLSCDHKPNRDDEIERIESSGGKVISWNGPRVMGVLGTSRSIEVVVVERMERDEFLILASDGLWDVVSNETACGVVRRCLATMMRTNAGGGPDKAASLLAELAICRGSADNISVIVVDLHKPADEKKRNQMRGENTGGVSPFL